MNLFDHLPDPEPTTPAADESGTPGQVVEVALNLPVDREFQYRIPGALEGCLQLGARVSVPFRNRLATGFCVGFPSRPSHPKLREVRAVVDDAPLLSDTLLALARWMADNYACSLGEALSAILPPAVRRDRGARRVAIVLPAADASQLREARAAAAGKPSRAAQARILDLLLENPEGIEATELRQRADCSASPIQTLERANLIRVEKREKTILTPVGGAREPERPPDLTSDQATVLGPLLAAIRDRETTTFVLHGVTGSGKTEVYLRAIEEVVRNGQQAIVLIPEISLTPQTVSRFRARFDRVAVLHSHLTDADRRNHWREIRAGGADVIVGARSAVFAPTPALGLIVIDEEHETSFKQNTAPRYHARETAVERARLHGVPVVLGSATPAFETYQRARAGHYHLLRMPRRVHERPMPPVEIVDLASEPRDYGPPPLIGNRLRRAMEASLTRNEQVLLFLNRRGHSTYLCCTQCGHVIKCERCDITLTFHQRQRRARCHYCSWETAPPVRCPACKAPSIRYLGAGTEKIEEEVRNRFPTARVERLDSDAARRRGVVEETLGRYRSGAIDILVGTQMIAKGLDFPNVTVVGIISADITLNLPDFRAAERTFQLVAQVAGRTGRGDKGGVVIVQTNNPGHDCIVHASRHDFEGFAAVEIPLRETYGYPPFVRLLRVLFQGKDETSVARLAGDVASALRTVVDEASLLGPTPAPIPYVDRKYRYQILVKRRADAAFGDVASIVRECTASRRDVGVTLDVDPIDTL